MVKVGKRNCLKKLDHFRKTKNKFGNTYKIGRTIFKNKKYIFEGLYLLFSEI